MRITSLIIHIERETTTRKRSPAMPAFRVSGVTGANARPGRAAVPGGGELETTPVGGEHEELRGAALHDEQAGSWPGCRQGPLEDQVGAAVGRDALAVPPPNGVSAVPSAHPEGCPPRRRGASAAA